MNGWRRFEFQLRKSKARGRRRVSTNMNSKQFAKGGASWSYTGKSVAERTK